MKAKFFHSFQISVVSMSNTLLIFQPPV